MHFLFYLKCYWKKMASDTWRSSCLIFGLIFLLNKSFVYPIQIINWRTYLKFPNEAKLSTEAKDLICRLMCNVELRLGTKGAHEIKVGTFKLSYLLYLSLHRRLCAQLTWISWCQAHPWFKGVQWDRLYQMEAAFIPAVTNELDTQNFEAFQEVGKHISFTFRLGWHITISASLCQS